MENFIYGSRAVIEAIKQNQQIDKILLQTAANSELITELRKLADQNKIQYQYVPVEKLNRLTKGNHQGVIAFTAVVEYQNIETILMNLSDEGTAPLVLMLDGITDVRNFGAICRTAECAGVHAVIIPDKGAAQINADAIKTSAGALNHLPICKVESLKVTLLLLKEYGLQVIACTEKSVTNYTDLQYDAPTAFVMGAEDRGISNDLLKLTDRKAKIPLLGVIDSLNVSVACGILLYESVRQRAL